jgi:hypothetical protein
MESSGGDMTDQDAGFDENPERDPGEELEAIIEQADRPLGSESFGTTAEEEVRGETLDARLAQERQGVEATDSALVLEDSGGPDEESELIADASMEHDAFVAPEEAAVHIIDEGRRSDS